MKNQRLNVRFLKLLWTERGNNETIHLSTASTKIWTRTFLCRSTTILTEPGPRPDFSSSASYRIENPRSGLYFESREGSFTHLAAFFVGHFSWLKDSETGRTLIFDWENTKTRNHKNLFLCLKNRSNVNGSTDRKLIKQKYKEYWKCFSYTCSSSRQSSLVSKTSIRHR